MNNLSIKFIALSFSGSAFLYCLVFYLISIVLQVEVKVGFLGWLLIISTFFVAIHHQFIVHNQVVRTEEFKGLLKLTDLYPRIIIYLKRLTLLNFLFSIAGLISNDIGIFNINITSNEVLLSLIMYISMGHIHFYLLGIKVKNV